MKKLLTIVAVFFLLANESSIAQCTTASLNWDNLDFLKQDPTYISASQAQTQYYAFGTNRLTIDHNYSTANTAGENAANTGETGSYGAGEDVQFTGNGSITLTFQTAVQNIKFSLYDIDYNQRVTITASNGGSPQNVTVAGITTAQLTIAGSGTASASATGGATTSVADNSTSGTINVDIAGSTTSVTITITQTGTKTNGPPSGLEDGRFFLSDISACITNTGFQNSYYATSRPFTNQPAYVLTSIEDSVLFINPANGSAKLLFEDPSGNNVNSVGYDPHNKFLYYCYSLTGVDGTPNTNNKSIQKYDVTTGTISTIVSNVNTLGIPTYTSGVESGGGAFYDGAFYIGIEGMDGEESKIWRIDFDASFNPVVPARQVFTMPTVNHDWSDFAISNGVLYDFNGKSTTTTVNYESIDHINLQTGATMATYNYATLGFVPRQVGVDWTEKIYNIGTAATASTGTIVPYANGAINTALQYTIAMGATNPTGSWGDAAEAFRPMADFGDAPSTYDPDPLAPALHEIITTLRLGNTVNSEWKKSSTPGTDANTDVSGDDGLTFVRIMNMRSGNYQTDATVFNNTGANATVAAWVDFNGDGVFQSGEGITQTVASSTGLQTISLYWTGITANLAEYSTTYLRIRVTSAANGMTINNPTGYFANGEVEDYKVLVNVNPLDVSLKSFTVRKVTEDKIKLTWSVTDEKRNTVYELQKSADGASWTAFYKKSAIGDNTGASYSYDDVSPTKPVTYYRLKISELNKTDAFSSIQKIVFNQLKNISFFPNPTSGSCKMEITSDASDVGKVTIFDVSGKAIYTNTYRLVKGNNAFVLPTQNLHNGVYTVQVITTSKYAATKLIVQK